ncbi:MAG TPA: SRPBCC family protein [Candidatus Acidoferrales bacterium]|nr:SRPBCC family protein [Candidatus Acidoferrales bacterium]
MKIVLLIFGTLIAIIVIALAIGAMLPVKHFATRSAIYHQPPDAIWQAITDYQKFPAWRPTVKRVEPLPPVNGLPAWRETDAHGSVLPMEIIESNQPVRLVTRITDPKLPFGGTWIYEITPASGGCRLRITENGEIYDIFFRFVSRFIIGYHGTMDTYLRTLGQKFGETVNLEN